MEEPRSVTRWIEQLRSDDPAVRDAAARQIWERYLSALLNVARDHLGQQVRNRVDVEDVLQSMYHSFCLGQQRGDFDLTDRDRLWALLVTITQRKASNAIRLNRRARRDVSREVAHRNDGSDSDDLDLELMDESEPTPADAVELTEDLERRIQTLLEPELRQIVYWKLERWTNQEISEKLGCAVRTVERKLKLIRDRWMKGD